MGRDNEAGYGEDQEERVSARGARAEEHAERYIRHPVMTTAVCCRPHEMDRARPPPTSESADTRCGSTTESGSVAFPHCPFALSPQQYTSPSAAEMRRQKHLRKCISKRNKKGR